MAEKGHSRATGVLLGGDEFSLGDVEVAHRRVLRRHTRQCGSQRVLSIFHRHTLLD